MNNRGRTRYNPVATSTEDEDVAGSDVPAAVSSNKEETSSLASSLALESSFEDELAEEDDGSTLRVIILDTAQQKFPITASPSWKVGKFKRHSARVHKVAPPQQRLIFRGKLLEDSKTLQESGITTDDLIVHLFPKPRVVMSGTSSNASVASSAAPDEQHGDEATSAGAHIPQIILDPEEQARRGQILVLGSHEILEAQSNVRLLSMLLFVVSLMRLLALMSIATGTAQEYVYEDDIVPGGGSNSTNHGPGTYEVREWETGDWYDLAVHAICFAVATLGCKATNENTSFLARLYLRGTIVAGLVWNAWNLWQYVIFVETETAPKDDDEVMPLTTDDFITVALFTLLMPLLIWGSCLSRAMQFRTLIEEAEQEATERIQSQLALIEGRGDEEEAGGTSLAANNDGVDPRMESGDTMELTPSSRSIV